MERMTKWLSGLLAAAGHIRYLELAIHIAITWTTQARKMNILKSFGVCAVHLRTATFKRGGK